jgi:hypothetical protein
VTGRPRQVQISDPPPPRKVGTPLSAEIPAPVSTATDRAQSKIAINSLVTSVNTIGLILSAVRLLE